MYLIVIYRTGGTVLSLLTEIYLYLGNHICKVRDYSVAVEQKLPGNSIT